jgi:hypothetical protein
LGLEVCELFLTQYFLAQVYNKYNIMYLIKYNVMTILFFVE